MKQRVVVVGAGSGACAAAVDLTRLGCDVLMLNRSENRLAQFHSAGGIRAIMETERSTLTEIRGFTTDVRQAMTFSSTVLVVVPTTALDHYARALGPHLTAAHKVLLVPGHTGGALVFKRRAVLAGADETFLAGETDTLPYVCRMTDTAEVTVWKRPSRVLAAALPATCNDSLFDYFSSAIVGLKPARSVLETSLNNGNAVMHPPGMVLNAGWIEHTNGGFKFYADGHPSAVGAVIDRLDQERVRLGAAFGLNLPRWIDDFYRAGYTTESAWRSGSASNAITHSEPNKEIDAPDSLNHRYLREDFGCGLVPMSSLAGIAGVETPVSEALITLGSIASGIDLRESGYSRTDMGLDGMTPSDVDLYVRK